MWMVEKGIIVDLSNRTAVLSKQWLFVDSFVVLLVFLLTCLSLIPIVFLRFLQGIVKHVNMFHYSEDIEGIDHESIPVVVLKPPHGERIPFIIFFIISLNPLSFFHCFVNSKLRYIFSWSGGKGFRLACQYWTDSVLPYVWSYVSCMFN